MMGGDEKPSDEEWRKQGNEKLQQARIAAIDKSDGSARVEALVDARGKDDQTITPEKLAQVAKIQDERGGFDGDYTDGQLADATNLVWKWTSMDRMNPDNPIRYKVGSYYPGQIWDKSGDINPEAMEWAEAAGLSGIGKINHGYQLNQEYDSEGFPLRANVLGDSAVGGDAAQFVASLGKDNAIKGHPDFRNYAAADPDALKAAIVAQAPFFKERGFASVEDYHAHVGEQLKFSNIFLQDANRSGKFMRWFNKEAPTQYEIQIDQHGEADLAAATAEVASLGYSPIGTNTSNVQAVDQVTGRTGEEETVDQFADWEKTEFGELGVMLMMVGVAVGILGTLQKSASGPMCAIENLAKSAAGTVKSIVEKVGESLLDLIKGVFKFLKRSVTSESKTVYNSSAYQTIKRWNNLQEAASMFRRANVLCG